jgi:hypothetical protein
VPQSHLGEPGSNLDISAPAKGILKSISEGIRTLVVLDENLLNSERKVTTLDPKFAQLLRSCFGLLVKWRNLISV